MTTRPPWETTDFKHKLRSMTDDELFGEWSREYDAKNTERAAIVIAEMGARHRSGVIEL